MCICINTCAQWFHIKLQYLKDIYIKTFISTMPSFCTSLLCMKDKFEKNGQIIFHILNIMSLHLFDMIFLLTIFSGNKEQVSTL